METEQTLSPETMTNTQLVTAFRKQSPEETEIISKWETHFSNLRRFDNKKLAIIGCGGVGIKIAELITQMLCYSEGVTVDLWDNDQFEKKNEDRQLPNCEGKPKSFALAEYLSTKYNTTIDFCPIWSNFPPKKDANQYIYDVIFVAADKKYPKVYLANNSQNLKETGILIVAGNEYDFYQTTAFTKNNVGELLDIYPDLLTKEETTDAKPCTGEIILSEPQLVLFNQLAATASVQMLWQYYTKGTIIRNCYEGNFITNNTFLRRSNASSN